jgi:hypothetical protein
VVLALDSILHDVCHESNNGLVWSDKVAQRVAECYFLIIFSCKGTVVGISIEASVALMAKLRF